LPCAQPPGNRQCAYLMLGLLQAGRKQLVILAGTVRQAVHMSWGHWPLPFMRLHMQAAATMLFTSTCLFGRCAHVWHPTHNYTNC
jgi:hypothetical protein